MRRRTVSPVTNASTSRSTSRGTRSRSRPAARTSRTGVALIIALAFSGTACEGEVAPQAEPIFDLEAASSDLFAIPYPNDLRLRPDGSIDLAHLGKGLPTLIQDFMDQVARNHYHGFGLNSAAYFRFTEPLDVACLPATPKESLTASSPLIWVNIDEHSPGYLRRVPVRWRYNEGRSQYIGANSLTLLPLAGFTLDPGAHHAVILTEALCDRHGRLIRTPKVIRELLAATPPADPALARAHQVYAPLRRYLQKVSLTGVVAATVFTTGDAADMAGRARSVLYEAPAPRLEGLLVVGETEHALELEGSYTAPNFQKGTPPFSLPADGGAIEVDGRGNPVPARTETLRFALTVPRKGMPEAGWPIVIYAHGTGGDYRNFVTRGLGELLAAPVDADGTPLPPLAMVGIDQNLHGPRDPTGGAPEITFFNFQNARAAAYNMVQAGIDDFSLLRMVKAISAEEVQWKVPPPSGPTRLTFSPSLRFDPSRIYFFGHSQGALTGSVFLAHEPEVRGALLSGGGGGAVVGMLERMTPLPVRALVRAAINDTADEFQPVMSLFQQALEPADPLNYARSFLHDRRPGVGPKHLFVSQGLVDHYTAACTTEAMAAAIGLPAATPLLRAIEALELQQIRPVALPLAGNLSIDRQAVTGALIQYRAVETGQACSGTDHCNDGYCDEGRCRSDGHFVVFRDPRARQHVARFFGTMARYGVPTLGP